MRKILAILLMAGCGPTPGTSPVSGGLDAHGSEGAPWIVYRCESGREVAAAYPTDSTAVVRYGAATYEMRIAVSASGARYTGSGYEWWTRGTGPGATGNLGRFVADEQTASQLVERCSIPNESETSTDSPG